MSDSSSDTAGPQPPTAPLRSANAILPPRSSRFELAAVFPTPAPLAIDVVGAGTHSSCHWLPTKILGPCLQRHAPLLFEIANACEDTTAVAGSLAARRNARLRTFTKDYFTTLYRATRAYLAELTTLGADILDGGEPLVLEDEFPDFVTTYVLPEDPPSPLHSPPHGPQ